MWLDDDTVVDAVVVVRFRRGEIVVLSLEVFVAVVVLLFEEEGMFVVRGASDAPVAVAVAVLSSTGRGRTEESLELLTVEAEVEDEVVLEMAERAALIIVSASAAESCGASRSSVDFTEDSSVDG